MNNSVQVRIRILKYVRYFILFVSLFIIYEFIRLIIHIQNNKLIESLIYIKIFLTILFLWLLSWLMLETGICLIKKFNNMV